jgi:hypothetical protein
MHQSNDSRRLILLSVAIVALIGGCTSPSAAVCSDGRTCPPNTRCDVERHLCIGDAQELACSGRADGDGCVVAGVTGNCRGGLCKLLFCGDGQRVDPESCDGADLNGKTCADLGFYKQTTGLKCDPKDCTFDTTGCTDACGDKMINGSELCDGSDLGGADCRTAGFYDAPGLRCSPYCTLDVSACTGLCGDAKINGPEQCDGMPPAGETCLDHGYDRGRLGCSALCGPQLDGCGEIGWKPVLAKEAQGRFTSAWADDPGDVFVVGFDGTIVRGSGTTWTAMSSGTTTPFMGVWGSGPDNVFAVGGGIFGSGIVLRWNGEKWSAMSSAASDRGYFGVWGSGPTDVFVVGSQIIHWNGTSWSVMNAPVTQYPYKAVWGTGVDDVFAVGDVIIHWDGKSWSEMATPPFSFPRYFNAIWGSGSKDVFAVGDGSILHWNGTAWSEMSSPPGFYGFYRAVWGSGPNDVLAIAMGTPAHLVHWDGTSWSPIAMVGAVAEKPPAAIWGTGPDDVFVASLGGIAHSNGDSWFATTDAKMSVGVQSLWAAGADDLFAGAPFRGGVLHWTGTGSSTTDLAAMPGLAPSLADDVWGSSEHDVFAVADLGRQILHWDGRTWSPSYSYTPAPQGPPSPEPAPAVPPFPQPTDLPPVVVESLWGSGANDVFAVGPTRDNVFTEQQGTGTGTRKGTCSGVMHWDGQSWSTMPFSVTDKCLHAVWGNEPGSFFAVGEAGVIVHWDGNAWATMSSGSTVDLSSVWGSGRADVYAVGKAGTILRFDGARWTPMPSGTTASLSRVRGSGRGDVFAVGGKVLLHLQAGAWEPIAVPPPAPIPGGAALDFNATSLAVTPSRVFLGSEVEILQLDRTGVTCVGPEKNCGDGWDNDCDGLADGADPDCAGKVAEQCANLVDDDGDGLVDCADPGCATFPSCRRR